MAAGITEGQELRRMGSGMVIVAAAAILAVMAIVVTARYGVTEWAYALTFGALILVGEMVQFRVDGIRNRAPIATSAALGYAMLRGPSLGLPPDVAQVAAVTAIATVGGILPRAIAGLPSDVVVSCRRGISVACAAAVFAALTPARLIWTGHWSDAIWIGGAMLAAVLSAASAMR